MAKKLVDGEKVSGYGIQYALSHGIDVIKSAEVCNGGKNVRYKLHSNWFSIWATVGKDFFLDRSEAEAQAKKNAQRKIESLQKQLTKLKGLAAEPKYAKERK